MEFFVKYSFVSLNLLCLPSPQSDSINSEEFWRFLWKFVFDHRNLRAVFPPRGHPQSLGTACYPVWVSNAAWVFRKSVWGWEEDTFCTLACRATESRTSTNYKNPCPFKRLLNPKPKPDPILVAFFFVAKRASKNKTNKQTQAAKQQPQWK